MKPLRTEYVSLSQLREWPENPKEHDILEIQASIERFGFRDPIETNGESPDMLAGHGRYTALVRLEQKYRDEDKDPPPGIIAQNGRWAVPVVRGTLPLPPGEAEAYLLANNNLTMNHGYRPELIDRMVEKVKATALGFTGTGIIVERAKRALEASRVAQEAPKSENPASDASPAPKGPEEAPPPSPSPMSTGLVPLFFTLSREKHTFVKEELTRIMQDRGLSSLEEALVFVLEQR